MIIDTHAHMDDEAFDEDRSELLSNIPKEGVEIVVNASADIEECKKTIRLTQEYSYIYGMLGVHPDVIECLNDESLKWMEDEINALNVTKGGKIVAVGEIGLDYYGEGKDDDNKALQKKWFVAQLELARRTAMPVNIHSRDAAKDTLDILRDVNAGEIGGIIHCYSYSVETAREFLNMDFNFGIGGVLTFKNARKLVEAVEYIPIDHLVLETDAPYLSPMPFRGQRNDSRNIKYVVSKMAEIKGISEEEVLRITNENAKRIYRINANAR